MSKDAIYHKNKVLICDDTSFDSNTLILPSNRDERRRLIHTLSRENTEAFDDDERKKKKSKKPLKKRTLRKIAQLEKKATTETIKASMLNELKSLQLDADIVNKLKPTVLQQRKVKDVKLSLKRRRHFDEDNDEDNDEDTDDGNTDDDDDDDTQKDNPNKPLLSVHTDQHELTLKDEALNKELNISLNEPQEAYQNKSCRRRSSTSDSSDTTNPIPPHSSIPNDWDLFQPVLSIPRTVVIERERSKLPALEMEQELTDAIINNDVCIVTGDTGCGKSTQVPQFIYEAGLCGKENSLIGITQPRRVAVVALAQRVSEELALPDIVGYQIRYDKSIKPSCQLKFMTDGILLKELQEDFLCRKYSVIILDEAHERSVNCDILIGLLSRAVQMRRKLFTQNLQTMMTTATPAKDSLLQSSFGTVPQENSSCVRPLRLVIMSATLRVTDFTENARLFPISPPVVHIAAKMYPVVLHFNKHTPHKDFIQPAAKKAVALHRTAPPGSILIFATGRREVNSIIFEIQKRLLNFKTRSDLLDDDDSDDDDNDDDRSSSLSDKSEMMRFSDTELFDDEEQNDNFEDVPTDVDDIVVDKTQNSFNDTTSINDYPMNTQEDDNIKSGFNINNFDDVSQFRLKGEEDMILTMKTLMCKNHPNTTLSKNDDLLQMDSTEAAIALGFEHGVDGAIPELMKIHNKNSSTSWLGSAPLHDSLCTVRLLPLYARLSIKQQRETFQSPQPNERIIIVSTNVAETSLTLPNIRYVIDCGREKKRRFLGLGDTQSVFSTHWISKASADQRSGRAGRTGPGHCYRLYSSAMYTHVFPQFPTINLFLSPLDSVVLFMASLGIPKLEKFPFPTPPQPEAVAKAQNALYYLGALMKKSRKENDYIITPLGRLMSQIPLSPRFSAMLIAAVACSRKMTNKKEQNQLLSACCCAIAGASIGDILEPKSYTIIHHQQKDKGKDTLENNQNIEFSEKCKKKDILPWQKYDSDFTALAWIISHFIETPNKEYFCEHHSLNNRQLTEAVSLYHQLASIISKKFPSIGDFQQLECPSLHFTSKLCRLIHDCVLMGLLDNIAVRCDLVPQATSEQRLLSKKGYYWCDRTIEAAAGNDPILYIHNSSCAHLLRPCPALIGFCQIVKILPITSNEVSIKPLKIKRFLKLCFPIDSMVLARINSPFITHSSFLNTPLPQYTFDKDHVAGFVKTTYSPLELPLPTICKPFPSNEENYNNIQGLLFGKAFLEGKVFENKIQIFKTIYDNGHLKVNPNVINPTVTNLLQHKEQFGNTLRPVLSTSSPLLDQFIQTLCEVKCFSRNILLQIWKKEPKFLLSQYEILLNPLCPKSLRLKLHKDWPFLK